MVARVVVVGAGYAGMSAARRLARSDDVSVTLVNSRPDFVERIRLHQLVAGNHAASRPVRDFLPKDVAFVVAHAVSLDTATQQLWLNDGTAHDYDYLVLAVGSRCGPSNIPGAQECAYAIDTFEAAKCTATRLRELERDAIVTVVGGGLTGIEAAAELAETTHHRIRLITRGPIGQSLGDRARGCVRTFFARHGVDLIERESVERVTETSVILSRDRSLASGLTIVAPAFEAQDLARGSALEVDERGALVVNEALVSVSSNTVIGAGDGAVLAGEPIRMSCQAAIPLGVHAAETALRLIAGREPKPVGRKFVGQCVSLGRREAVFQYTDRSDAPRPHMVLSGRLGAVLKELICAGSLSFGRVGGFTYSWSKAPTSPAGQTY